MNKYSPIAIALLGLAMAGCATYPTGPSMMALPGTQSSFEQFQADDASCQAYAAQSAGITTQDAAASSGVDSAAVGTVVGAAAGALIGAASGNPAAGAAIGGGSGLILGAASGTDAYDTTGYRTQDRYDNAYTQCMYARGHQVPVPASVAAQINAQQAQQAQPMQTVTVPPANTPPPGGIPIGTAVPTPTVPPPNTPPPPGY